ncbi:DUF664 domain-containing protein [Mangrovimonas sp. ST2L15]|uniref:mycothiol transferase n=1 Tax=Mangrovimonas sp. ST2L15 TaxID=1645916 RepID=UPI0006B4E36C|nr:DUF664 domain-containing protein [Mangrovimonas sp. ST2L15]
MKKAILITFLLVCINLQAQYTIEPPKGYSHDIGNMIVMLDNLKGRVEYLVKDLNQEQTDFLLDDNSNRIGALIYHLAATEAHYQVFTFEKRDFNEAEKEKWMMALSLGDEARAEFQGKPIQYYMDLYDEVRNKTKELMKTKDDKWFSKTNKGMSNHWAWFHVMEHQANHMGQLAYLTKRLPKE